MTIQLSIREIIFQAGISPGNHPRLLSECFKQPVSSGALSAISKAIKKHLPEKIDNRYESISSLCDYILMQIYEKPTKSISENKQEIEWSIEKIVGFLILRDHKDVENYADLMQMRNVILEAKKLLEISAKGAHTNNPKYTEQVQNSVRSSLSATGISMVQTQHLFEMVSYIASKALLENDCEATELSKQFLIAYKNQKLIGHDTIG